MGKHPPVISSAIPPSLLLPDSISRLDDNLREVLAKMSVEELKETAGNDDAISEIYYCNFI